MLESFIVADSKQLLTTLGVILYNNLTFNSHVSADCQKSFLHLLDTCTFCTKWWHGSIHCSCFKHSLDWIVPTLSVNSISARNLAKLQCIQNVAVRIVAYHLQPKRPASSHLFRLHWLPIEHWINLKIATLTYKTLATGQPSYLLNLLNTYQPLRSLRSQDSHLLAKPSVYTSLGRRAFSYAAPQIWNTISVNICVSPSVSSFKRNLKTLFCCCFLTLQCVTRR